MLFDWDDGNRPKCQKHGLTIELIEAVLSGDVTVGPDPFLAEDRYRAFGWTAEGRAVMVIFTVREREDQRIIRPISARYMHAKEVRKYERDQG